MPLHRPTELIAWLQQEQLFPKKGLSQNFLIDRNIVEKIVQLANLKPNQHIIEIGPGPGVLTEYLLEKKYRVSAIETDEKLAQKLPRLGSVDVYHKDALKMPWSTWLNDIKEEGKPLTLISNVPYHLSTPLLGLLLPLGAYIDKLVLMLQKEFTERLMAPTNIKSYGPLSILSQYYAQRHGSFLVKPHSFYPPPHVHSTVLRLDLQARDTQEAIKLTSLLEDSFTHRRKILKGTLEKMVQGPSVELFETFKNRRPETLALDDWLKLVRSRT